MFSRRAFLCSSVSLSLWPLAGKALEEGKPSSTARGTALQRAAHQLLETPRVFDDPVALGIFGAEGVRWLGLNLDRYRTQASRAMRAFLVMRSRYAEDRLAGAYARGVRQYVVLGAGLDTFACRNPHRGLRVFEVDFPATQRWKRDLLKAREIALPRSLTFAPVDFERQTLAQGLEATGWRADRPTFYSWLGVTIYLSAGAVRDTLASVARGARGSEIVFDFAPPPETMGESERRSHLRQAAAVARLGEPWVSYFEPERFAAELRGAGYASAQHLGADDMNARYFSGRSDGFRMLGSGRMMSART
jgi:methyltransferase (TIGR00027 family)